MADMLRARAVLSGWIGGPGLFTAYFGGPGAPTAPQAQEAASRVRAFWDSLKANVPATVLINVDPTVATLDPATGTLTGFFGVNPGAGVSGTSPANFAPIATAANLRYITNVVVNGRSVVGRSYLSPLTVGALTPGGVISGAYTTAAQTAGNLLSTTILTGVSHLVWHRPGPAGAGLSAIVASYSCSGKPAVLRSRRD